MKDDNIIEFVKQHKALTSLYAILFAIALALLVVTALMIRRRIRENKEESQREYDASTKAGKEILEAFAYAQRGYIFWYGVYIILGLCSIVLPAISASKLIGDYGAIFALGGSVAAAVIAFVRPYEYATAFDTAVTSIWRTDVAYNLGQINDKEVSERLASAIALINFKYGAPSTINPEAPQPAAPGPSGGPRADAQPPAAHG